MKFVALVSGGKDSCFNILHCLSQDHELVALANLHPQASVSTDEIDSFMYQTVGYNVLLRYLGCIGVPMYRKEIAGHSKNVSLQYETTLNDETEDLWELLQTVQKHHPDVEAVSVGAILSTYQRVRVEHVCLKLGLVSLSYLWQRDQDALMQEMCASAMDARILKVAAYGLDQNHLGKSLREMYPTLKQLNSQFEVHICGEGGEFETIVLDAPFFINKKIVISKQEEITHSANDDVYYLKLDTEVQSKDEPLLDLNDTDWNEYVTKQPLLSPPFKEIYNLLPQNEYPNNSQMETSYCNKGSLDVKVSQIGNKVFISNLSGSPGASIESQTKSIFTTLQDTLSKQFGITSTRNIISINLLVTSMSQFATINAIYALYFPNPLPPSRTCVETILPDGVHLSLSCVVLTDEHIDKKLGLHVQSRSYWAPANIGPYSQAGYESVNFVANLAGQIPLIPASMELINKNNIEQNYAGEFDEQVSPFVLSKLSAVLSLKHIVSVKDVIGCDLIASMVCYVADEDTRQLVPLAAETFKQYNVQQHDEHFVSPVFESLLIVEVATLPKNASIEWSGVSYKKYVSYDYEEDSDEEKEEGPKGPLADVLVEGAVEEITAKSSLVINNKEFIATLWYRNSDIAKSALSQLLQIPGKVHLIVFARPTDANVQLMKGLKGSVDFVPVQGVHNYKAEPVEFGVVVRGAL